MATGNTILDKGYRVLAGQTLTKFRCVKYSTTPETVTNVAAIGDMIAGVALFAVSAAELLKGKGAVCRQAGIVECECSAAIALGALCELVADGRVRTATASSGARIVGRCVGHPSTNAGDRISMEIIMQGGLVGATF
jgi:hypothetical protein